MSRREPAEAAEILCPFYLWSDARSLTCEGHGEGIKTVSQFRRKDDKRAFLQQHCAEHYKRCPVYEAAMVKYR